MIHRFPKLAALTAFLSAIVTPSGGAQLTVVDSMSVGSGPPGLGYDRTNDTVWSYSSGNLGCYAADGSLLFTFAAPATGNDLDIDSAPEDLALAGIPVPKGTLLFIHGEVGNAEIYAIDKESGAVLAILPTMFGHNHVVGGAYHPGRDTFFLVEDRMASSAAFKNVIAEVDPLTGAVLNSFKTTDVDPSFTVNWGDLEVSAVTGNLLIVSSDESSILELTPTGSLVSTIPLPVGPTALSGIGLTEKGDDLWVCGEGLGIAWHLSGLPPFWKNLGGETPGVNGPPLLVAAGALTAGSSLWIDLKDAPASTPVLLLASTSSTPVGLFGGTFFAFPPTIQFPSVADAAGSWSLETTWGSGIPSGMTYYVQFGVLDSSVPALVTLSNAVAQTVP